MSVRMRVLDEVLSGRAKPQQLARTLGIGRTTIENWLDAYRQGGVEALVPKPAGPPTGRRSPDYETRRSAVVELREEHPEYGTRRIRDALARFQALGVSESEVRRILHEAGLLEATPEAREPRQHPERRFERAAPNQLWQSDIFTFLLRRHQRVHLTVFMDDHSRFIVSHATAHHCRTELVLEALDRGLAAFGTPEEILTDNGPQYATWRGETDFQTWSVRDDTGSPRFTALGGNDTDLHPPILYDLLDEDPLAGSPYAGPNHYAIVKGVLALRSWSGTDLGVIWKGGLDLDPPVWAGQALFWGVESIARSELWIWTESDGARTLVTFGSDLSKSAASGGTDGKDMIWLQGEERALDGSSDGTFPKRSVMTAPFTTDTTTVEAKRLRSWPAKSIWGARPAVGCGYAAYRHTPDNDIDQVLIVRLSDGVSWLLDSPADHHWWWGGPIALTCKELFVSYGKYAEDRIRRIQLDSLGPGLPPD